MALDLNIDELQKQADEANEKKGMLGAFGGALQNVASVPTAYEQLHLGGQSRGPNIKGMFDSAAGMIKDPWEKQKKTYEMYQAAKQNTDIKREEEDLNSSRDPNSNLSKSSRYMYEKFSGRKADPSMSDYEVRKMMNPAKMFETEANAKNQFKYDMEKLKFGKESDRETRLADHAAKRQEKQEEQDELKRTPFGVARTADDAKKLKDAHEIKSKFDAGINEMIALRKKHKGGDAFNREDVKTAERLSTDLMLQYKDLSNLGVMSKSDEALLRTVIPKDPLQYRSLYEAGTGQDSTLRNMEKFKEDSDRDFQTRLDTRLSKPITVVDIQENKKTGERREIYSDGSVKVIKPTMQVSK